MLAGQGLLLGNLATDLKSPWLAASAANLSVLALGLAMGLSTGRFVRGWRRWRATPPPRWACFHGCFAAGLVAATAFGVPIIGVAVLSAAVVAGQVVGSMVIDTIGLGVPGRVAVTPTRLIGVAAALGSVSLTVQAVSGLGDVIAATVAAVAGVGFAAYQAGMGHHQRSSGEPIFGALLGFATASVPLAIAALLTRNLASVPDGWTLSIGDIAIAPLGLGVGLLVSRASSSLSVVQLTVSMVFGQVATGAVLDMISAGRLDTSVRGGLALVLMFTAVVLVSRTSARGKRRV